MVSFPSSSKRINPLTSYYHACAEGRVVAFGHPSSSFRCNCAIAFLLYLYLYHLGISAPPIESATHDSPPWGWSTAFMAAPLTVGLLPRRLARPAFPRLIYWNSLLRCQLGRAQKSMEASTYLLTDPMVATAPGENFLTSPLVILTKT